MKIEQDDVCVQCGKPIPAQGLGMVCYSCSREDDGRPMRTDETRCDSIRAIAKIKWSESSDHAVNSVYRRKRASFLHRLLSKTKKGFSPDGK